MEQNTSVVLDYNYRWLHTVGGYDSCTTSSGLNQTLCPTEAECAKNCAVEGVNYTTSGVTTSGDSMTLTQYYTNNGTTGNVSPRVYLLGPNGDYEMLQLLGQEMRYDVDVSKAPCGENGALYLSQMDATGGRSADNPAGANYGGGYCDAQCPVENFINGTVNTAHAGYCCNEMDIWEANSEATALTPHPCEVDKCDSGGCGFNPYAQGNPKFYGPGGTVDTTKPFTVITQFYTNDNTTTGTLVNIERLYIQNGKLIQNPTSTTTPGLNSITASWCSSSDSSAASLGGLTTMGKALGEGMVLVFAMWNDNSQYMNWLDSGSSGPCSATAGNPSLIEAQDPGTAVTFSNIRWGDIGSTFSVSGSGSSPGTSSTASSSTPTSTAATTTQSHYGQCGGAGYTGPTVCASPYKCVANGQYYSQCL